MTAPQLPAGWGAPSAPAAPPAQQPYPQQFAPQPQAQPQYAPQAYAPPAQFQQPYPPQGYAPQQFGQPQMPAPMAQQYGYPQQPAAPQGPAPQTGTLAAYASQPEAGANFWKFKNPGDSNTGIVARDLVDTDTKERTFRGQVQKRFDGSPDWVLSIPMKNADGTDGIFEVGGKDRTALKNALIAAGKADGIPAAGWAIRATFTHFQQNNGGGQPSRIKQIEVAPPATQTVTGGPADALTGAPGPAPQPTPAQQHPEQATATTMSPFPGQPTYLQQPVPAQQAAPPAAAQPQAQPAPGPAYQQPQQFAQQAPAPQQFAAPQGQPGGQFAGMPADAAAQFQTMLGGAQPPAQG